MRTLRDLFVFFLIFAAAAAADPAEKPAETQETPLPLGKVVELAVHDDDPGSACAVDLDTGKLITVPTTDQVPLGAPQEQWLRKRGIDVVGETAWDYGGLGAFDMKIAGPLPEEKWNAGPEETGGLLALAPSRATAAMRGAARPPATWAFQTREGGEGILQITGVEGEHITIRYRLTRRLRIEELPLENGTVEVVLIDDDTGAPIEGARVSIAQLAMRAVYGPDGRTGEKGTVRIEAPPGTYRGMDIIREGYTYAAREAPPVFALQPGGHVRIAVAMRKSARGESVTHLVLRMDPPRSILGETLPPLEDLGLGEEVALAGVPAAVCFWDCADDLSKAVVRVIDDSGAAGTVLLVHAGEDTAAARTWLRENRIDLPCGALARDDAALDTWGVREIPWIVCADESGMVTATTGFSDDIRVRVRHYLPDANTKRVDLERQTTPTTD